MALHSPEQLDGNQGREHEHRYSEIDEDPLQGMIDRPRQQAVRGQAPAGHCGKGKLGSVEDPVHRAGGRDVDGPQKSDVL